MDPFPSTTEEISTTFKLFSIILTATFSLIVLSLSTAYLLKAKNRFLPSGLEPIATINYTRSPSVSIGTNLIPLLNLPTKIGHYENKFEFLLDSGAVISTLPFLESSDPDIDHLERIILSSATDHITYGYLTDMQVELNHSILTIPVALSDISVPVLGRYGFFDRYTLIFDHQAQAVTIAQTKD